MAALAKSRSKILILDKSKQKLDSDSVRCNKAFKFWFKKAICDKTTLPLMLLVISSFVFFIVCAFLEDKTASLSQASTTLE